MCRNSKVLRNVTVAADTKRVVGGVVVGEAALPDGSCGRVEFPTQTNVRRQFGSHEPLVLSEGEELPRPVVGEESSEVAASLTRNVEEEAGKVIVKAGF